MEVNLKELITLLEFKELDTELIRVCSRTRPLNERCNKALNRLYTELKSGVSKHTIILSLHELKEALENKPTEAVPSQQITQMSGVTIETIKELLNTSLKGLKNNDPNLQIMEAIKELNTNIKTINVNQAQPQQVIEEQKVELDQVFIDLTHTGQKLTPTNVSIEAKKDSNIQDKLKKLKQILKEKKQA
jgi:hypothetical protein